MRIPISVLLAVLAIVAALPGGPAAATTITVTTDLDADAVDGFCSLREALRAANDDAAHNECPAGSGADRIVFSLALPATIVVASDLPAITDTVAIRGPGSDLLAIDGQTLYRLFVFASASGGEWYLLEDLSVQHGYANTGLGPDGGGVYVGPGETAVLSRVVVAENTAANGGGGIAVDGLTGLPAAAEIYDTLLIGNLSLGATGGGGLLVTDGSTAVLSGSSVIANRTEAQHGNGAGILVQRSTLTVAHSTLSGNAAYDSGGAILVSASGSDASLSLVDSTVYDNLADADFDLGGNGGGIVACCITSGSTLEIELRNSIVAGNLDDGALVHPDLSILVAAVLTASGYNLIGANDGAAPYFPAGNPNSNGDFAGTIAAPIDPMLQPLALNNGTTVNHRPVLDAASPVIDHGACPGQSGDQRGRGDASAHLRIIDHPAVPNQAASDGCDIGSVERGGSAGSAAELFRDGFELGHTLRWDAEAP